MSNAKRSEIEAPAEPGVIVAGLDHDSNLQAILAVILAGGGAVAAFEGARLECVPLAAAVAEVNGGQKMLQRERESARRVLHDVGNEVARHRGGRVPEDLARREADAERTLYGIEQKFEAGRGALEAAGAALEKGLKAARRAVLTAAVRHAHRRGVAAQCLVTADTPFLMERPAYTPEAFLRIHSGIVDLAELGDRIVVRGTREIMAAFGDGLGKDGLAILEGALESRPLYRSA